MPAAKDVFVRCDELENLPEPNRLNYLAELELLDGLLPSGASVLQVGSMDGQRIIRLSEMRPDLVLSGLEIEGELVELARSNIAAAGVDATIVLGDVTQPPRLSQFDFVLCLNNTLGYIDDVDAALREMRRVGDTAIVSVYGEAFGDELAVDYFKSIGLVVDRVEDNTIHVAGFGLVKRFARDEVESWGGKLVETPIGYTSIIQ